MIVVIIAGGAGSRLWPLSTPDYPKHLLKINGDSESLLQQTYKRSKKLSNKIYVVSEIGHIEHVKSQLPDLEADNFIIEPGRRGTANCIIVALERISTSNDLDEPVVFLSADHYIRDIEGFEHSFNIAADASSKEKRIVLVGVEPNYAATGFGYIEKGKALEGNSLVYNVNSFKEKPDFNLAKSYLKSGRYLWNCGYFIGSVNTFIDNMNKFAPLLYESYIRLAKTGKSDYNKVYLSLNKDTIDYALIEKIRDLLVTPAYFDWMDLGSFNDLHKSSELDEKGNNKHGEKIELYEVENSLVQNHEDKPIAVIGLDNIVVINTKEGLLVTRKDLSQIVGEVSKKFNG